MKLTAIIAVRNESLFIGRCCAYLESQGIDFAIIDNESTDDTRAIAESFRGRGLTCIVNHPYPGFYDWISILKHKEQLARELDSDWFMHLDADEIPQSPQRDEPLLTRLGAVDAEGYTAVNFDEFVFVPASPDARHEGDDYVKNMYRYFFFEPHQNRLIRAWRRTMDIELMSSGGHGASFSTRRIYPQNFVLRHYIALSMEHLVLKYKMQRAYAPAEVAMGWHGWRPRFAEELVRMPPLEELHDIRTDSDWNRSHPRDHHLFLKSPLCQ